MQTVDLAFEEYGEQHGEPVLLILHGFFASSRNWRTIAKRLADHRRVMTLDMRNHGASPHHPLMDYSAMVADVLEFMEKRRLGPVDVLGHSMGGKIAMWLALNYPERINQLLVADIAPVNYPHSFDNTINALKQLPLAEFSNRKQLEQWLEPAIAEAGYRQFLLQNLALVDGNYSWRINLGYFHDNASFITGFPQDAGLSAYPKPALFLVGENSAYVQADAVYPYFPQARIVGVPGAGHWLHVDAPQLFCQIVLDWLQV